jgi:hypothetical protein
MAASTDTYDVRVLESGGLVNESVMQTIFDLSTIPLPFTDRVGSMTHSNTYHSWPLDRLAAAVTNNAVVETKDGSWTNNAAAATYSRVGNQTQISVKEVEVTSLLRSSDTIGYRDALAYMVMKSQKELRRDVEANSLANTTAVPFDGGSTAGATAGLESWVSNKNELDATIYDSTAGNPSQYRDLSTGGITIGGWPAITPSGGVGNVAAVGYGSVSAVNAITETAILDVIEQLYNNGFGDSNNYVLMARPSVKRRISQYCFSSSARIGTLVQQMGDSTNARIANGSVDIFKTDFGVLEMVPNRLQPASGDGSPVSDTVFIFDPGYVAQSYMQGYRMESLAKTGLLDKRLITVAWSLVVKNWTAVGAIFGVDKAAAMTAS